MIPLRPDDRLLSALVQLTATPNGQAILSWLENIHAEQKTQLVELADPRVMQLSQGAAQFLAELLEVAKTAKSVLEERKHQESQRR